VIDRFSLTYAAAPGNSSSRLVDLYMYYKVGFGSKFECSKLINYTYKKVLYILVVKNELEGKRLRMSKSSWPVVGDDEYKAVADR